MGGEKFMLRFNCGVCATRLSDADALFTSCGHFFCGRPGKRCTGLVVGSPAGKCELCGQECNAGTLENQAAGYDEHVKSFVFASLPDELKKLGEIIEFRERHLNILSDNAAALVQRNAKLKEEISRQMQENNSLRSEIENLQRKLGKPPKVDVVDLIDDGAQSEVTPVREPEVSVAPTYVPPARERQHASHARPQVGRKHVEQDTSRKRQNIVPPPLPRERKHAAQEPSRQRHYAAAPQVPRERKQVDPVPPRQRHYAPAPKERPRDKEDASKQRQYATKPRPQEQRRPVPQGRLLQGSSRNPSTYRSTENSRKRDRFRMHETENAPQRTHAQAKSSSLLRKSQPRAGNNLGRTHASRYGGSSAARLPAPRSYTGGNASAASRFTSTPSQRWQNRKNASTMQMSTRSLGNSWQARVSVVPRPSVTPDQLERMRKRPRQNVNPVTSRR